MIALMALLLALQAGSSGADLMTTARARLADDRPAARALFEQAAAACEAASDPAGAGRAYNQLGLMAFQDSAGSNVGLWYRRAAEAFERAGLAREQALAWRAITFDATLPTADKLAALDRAARVAETIEDPGLQGLITHARGDTEFTAGRYAESQRHLDEALGLLEKAQNPQAIARVLTSLGRAFRLHGRPERALEQYQRALSLQEQVKDLPGQAQTTNAIAISLLAMGQVSEAVSASERALSLARESGARSAIVNRTGGLAVTYTNARRYAQAEPLLLESIRSHVEAGDEEAADIYYINLSTVQLALGRPQDAVATATRGLDLATRAGNPEFVYPGHLARALAFERLDRLDDALADATRAVEIVESLRATLVPQDALKQGFAETNRDVFSTLIRLLSKAGRHQDAMLTAERGRGRAFLDLLATRSVEAEGGGAETLLGRFRDPKDPTLRSFVSADPLPLDAALATARRLHSHILTYWVEPGTVTICVMSPEGVVNSKRVDVAASRLERLVRATWETKQADAGRLDRLAAAPTRGPVVGRIELDQSSRAAFRELYDALVLPVRQWLPSRGDARLTVVPHGLLFRLSFAGLTNERGQYLVEGYSLHYSPSIALLAVTESRRPVEGDAPHVLVADSDPRMLVSGAPLPPLPAARREIDGVAAVLGTARVVRLTGASANELRVREVAPSARVLHFATHGIVPDDRPFDAFLALGSDGSEPARDGRLSAREVYDLNLRTELVVLSGCRTARGPVTGDGVLGLSRAFLYSGTQSLMATLWDVYDESGAQLLPLFYAEWRRSGDKAEALRRAQIDLIRRLRAGSIRLKTAAGDFVVPEHPAFWAGFVLVGEP